MPTLRKHYALYILNLCAKKRFSMQFKLHVQRNCKLNYKMKHTLIVGTLAYHRGILPVVT